MTFAYVPGEPVLKDVSFEVQPGQRIGIVGATGSGKTTLMSLLLRFYDVQEGRITIDGDDIRTLDLDSLRAQFGLVLQDVHLFSGTIAGNVRLGHADITDDAVRRAVDAVHAGPFIDRLPGGLDAAGGGARQHTVGRAEAAAVVRAGAGDGSARPHPRRSDVERGHRNRTADS